MVRYWRKHRDRNKRQAEKILTTSIGVKENKSAFHRLYRLDEFRRPKCYNKNTVNNKMPDPNTIHPIPGYDKEIYIKPTIKNPNIIVGDFTYIADSEFESHVTHHYDFNGDKLIIGKFCQIAAGVEFIMNGANHQRNCVTTFPFYTLEGWQQEAPNPEDLALKGDTIIGNDVWIGQNVTFLPGVKVGDGAIIGANSVVRENVEPYTVVINELIPILTSSDLTKAKWELSKLV